MLSPKPQCQKKQPDQIICWLSTGLESGNWYGKWGGEREVNTCFGRAKHFLYLLINRTAVVRTGTNPSTRMRSVLYFSPVAPPCASALQLQHRSRWRVTGSDGAVVICHSTARVLRSLDFNDDGYHETEQKDVSACISVCIDLANPGYSWAQLNTDVQK